MRAIIYTAIGFWLSRQFYERHLKAKEREKLDKTKYRLGEFLKEKGFSSEEINQAKAELFRHYEFKN